MGPVTLGMPFSEARATMPHGTTNDPERCGWLAWWNSPGEQYNVYAAGSAEAPDAGPVTLVAAEEWADPTSAPGPRTAEGIGIGSTVDEVRAAYPEVSEISDSVDSSMVHLRVGQMFFTYREEPVIRSVTVTTADLPPYELCG
ncbi:hypothetical protein [Microbacterium timonense]|uniref:hypothetical protein n=1 Tax=Microbacterium timonense TaxID=2086576 RepID=UPI0013588328|nr:hypothetical protein [Microbacterium timonense]